MDLKEFLERKESASQKGVNYVGFSFKEQYPFFVEQLGLFFWERGGKQFVLAFEKDSIEQHKERAELSVEFLDNESVVYETLQARDFLDALDCLGEEKIKELIKWR